MSADLGEDWRQDLGLSGGKMTAIRSPEHPAARESLIGSLSSKIDDVLGSLIPPGSSCAHLDFPDHPNVGDSAIWLGERLALRRAHARVVYVCSHRPLGMVEELTARLTRDEVILLHGGGNFGDLWPRYQCFREEVIAAFPTHRIIQLPQTIYFREQSNLERAKSIINNHPDLTLLVRDLQSLEFARREFAAPSYLCPDMAFALGLLRRPVRPAVDVLWLCRTDLESSGWALDSSPAGIERVDWLDEADTGFAAAIRSVGAALAMRPRALRRVRVWRHMIHVFDALARQRLLRGCRILSRGKVVMTDRLHGHILSLLLGAPHILLDNNYGKLRSFYETWTRDSTLTLWAGSPAEAVELARSGARSLS